MLEIDTSMAHRSYGELMIMAQAIVAADDADENDFLEWKSVVDISKPGGAGKIARGILGFANRDAGKARHWCEGLAYIFIGVEPGQIIGCTNWDAANVNKWVGRYLPASLHWTYTNIEVEFEGDGRRVAIFIVEAPKAGDRIHALRKQFDEMDSGSSKPKTRLAGTIFVREQSETKQASAEQIEMLESRLLTSLREPAAVGSVDWVANPRVLILALEPEDISAALLSECAAVEQENSRHQAPYGNVFGKTNSNYDGEVELYLQKYEARVADAARSMVIGSGYSDVQLSVFNGSDTAMLNAELRVEVPRGYEAFDSTTGVRMPKRPRKYSEYVIASSMFDRSSIDAVSFDRNLEVDGNSIRFFLGDIHPKTSIKTSSFTLIQAGTLAESMPFKWTLSANNRTGLLEGTFAPPESQMARPIWDLVEMGRSDS